MCFIVKHFLNENGDIIKPLVASEDIPVYKYAIHNREWISHGLKEYIFDLNIFRSHVYYYEYEKDKDNPILELKPVICKCSMGCSDCPTIIDCKDTRNPDWDNNCKVLAINGGYHSFADIEKIFYKVGGYDYSIIGRFAIPAGSKYYVSDYEEAEFYWGKEYISSNIIFKEHLKEYGRKQFLKL